MDIAWADWFGLAVRWLHFTAGIACINFPGKEFMIY